MTQPLPGRRIAVVLFNLGGPDDQASVKPFLFNLFNDPAIIGLPGIFRTPLAKLISSRRETSAQANYALMGGGSPLLPETSRQDEALQAVLGARLGGDEVKVFIAMRYWHPLIEETVAAVKAFMPDEILLVPLYPQFSTTTTGSFLTAWHKSAADAGLSVSAKAVCCYPLAGEFIRAHAERLREAIRDAGGADGQRILFSAHGLPKRIVERGDPYQWQVERTAEAIVAALDIPGLDWRICYQSRVGPLEWIGPATDGEIIAAGADGRSLIVVPIAFVSEHSETLVELDIEYRHLAERSGVRRYCRVATPGAHEAYISSLVQLVGDLVNRKGALQSQDLTRLCPAQFKSCPNLQWKSVA